jgi:quinoprotein glucose dehydrogenase
MTRDFLLRAIFAGVSAVALHGQIDWPSYGHDAGGMRFSPLKQINTRNVSRLPSVPTGPRAQSQAPDGSPAPTTRRVL